MRKVTRDVERDRRELEREEKKLEMEIKKAAKLGNKQAATVLAKQLINVRKQKTRSYAATSRVRRGWLWEESKRSCSSFLYFRFKQLVVLLKPWELM